jgi:hypothetical protein
MEYTRHTLHGSAFFILDLAGLLLLVRKRGSILPHPVHDGSGSIQSMTAPEVLSPFSVNRLAMEHCSHSEDRLHGH